jgi:hypothetical protein
VLEFQGIKFTSRSFQLEVALKQVLLVSNVPIFQSCVIRKPHVQEQRHEQPLLAPVPEEPEMQMQEEPRPDPQEPRPDPQEPRPDPQEPRPDPQEPESNHNSDQEPNQMQPVAIDSTQLQEVNLDVLEELEHMHLKLKKPTEVYYNLYRIAKQKAKELKKNAIAAHLEAKQIKSAHMLEDSDSDSDNSVFSCN